MPFNEPLRPEHLFETPPHLRPQLDLAMSPLPGTMPPHLRAYNDDVTRWFNVVFGLAVDGAIRRDVKPEKIIAALETGRILAHAHFVLGDEDNDYALPTPQQHASMTDEEATFIGRVQTGGANLMVAGGNVLRPLTMVSYVKRGMDYVPRSARLVRPLPDESVATIDLPDPYIYSNPLFPRPPIPDELWPAFSLGNLASAAKSAMEAGTMAVRADVTIQSDDPQERA